MGQHDGPVQLAEAELTRLRGQSVSAQAAVRAAQSAAAELETRGADESTRSAAYAELAGLRERVMALAIAEAGAERRLQAASDEEALAGRARVKERLVGVQARYHAAANATVDACVAFAAKLAELRTAASERRDAFQAAVPANTPPGQVVQMLPAIEQFPTPLHDYLVSMALSPASALPRWMWHAARLGGDQVDALFGEEEVALPE